MKQEEITEGNKLIAEFMGFKIIEGKKGMIQGLKQWRATDIKNPIFDLLEANDENSIWFHKNWRWLMPVVEKIEKKTKVMVIHKERCALVSELPYSHGKTTLEAVWKMVVEAIKWLNKNKSKKK